MDKNYAPLTADDNELWERHAQGIRKSVREAFSSIPESFELKPATIRKIGGCGMFYDFKIGLPDGQYAKVSFHTGGYQIRPEVNVPKKEQKYTVDPEPSPSKDE
ncbi:hypothetical protein I4U23_026764 [Adineta vaga]|nr:hypothetical protein I4U23_026764 [Adineta vaga]